MSFAPVHFVHPFRVRDYGVWLPVLAILWAAASAPLLWPDWSRAGARRLALDLGRSRPRLDRARPAAHAARPAPARAVSPAEAAIEEAIERENGGRGKD